MDDAQKMFCRKTDGISDATTPAVTQITVALGDTYKATHKSILKIRQVTRADTGRDVEVLNYEDLNTRDWRFDGTSGPVKAFVVGEENNKARVYPVPNESLVLNLLVFRLPLKGIVDDGTQLELSDEHHPHLLHWMKRRAYLKQDSETFDKNKAVEFESYFNAYCAMTQEEERRKRHKKRTVVYGGI